MATDVPLLSSYKRGFVLRRFLHTFTGLKLFPGRTPVYTWLIRLGIWITPTTISLGFSFINVNPIYPAWLAATTLVFTFCVAVQLFSTWRQSKKERNVSNILLDEEAAVEWDGALGPNTWKMLVPRRKYTINIFIFSFLASIISFLSSVILKYQVIASFFSSGISAGCVFLFCWLTVLVSMQSLISQTIPETAIWRHVTSPDIQALARPATLILCQAITYGGIYFWNIFSITNIFYIVQTLLPLGWLLGILPPLDSFLIWAGEQVVVTCYGGSQTSSSAVLAAQLLAASTQLAVTIGSSVESERLLTVSSVFGYILSTNWSQGWRILEKCKLYKSKIIPENYKESNNNIDIRNKANGKPKMIPGDSETFIFLQELLAHVFLLTTVFLLSIFIPTLSSLEETALSFGWVLVTLQTGIKIIQESQKVYFIFGLVRSPFFEIFKKNSNSLSGTILKIMIRFLHPISTSLLLQTYILINLTTESVRDWGGLTLKFINILATQRAFRWIWQNTDSALWETALLYIIRFVARETSDSVSNFYIREIPFSLQLMMTSFLVTRLSQCLEKLYLFFSLTASAIEDKAARRPYAFILFQLNIFLFPLISSIIVITSVFSSPLLSMFTLPIFFISYPRPSRFWAGEVGTNAASSTDTVYYQQSLRSVITKFNSAARNLRLGEVQPESMFLLRFEDKIFWIKILEKGNGFLSYNLKGLELQETSCHSLEATRIDDIFEATFEKKTKLNNFGFHTLTPLTQLSVKMYSDTRNNLTSILTSQDTLADIAQVFVKVSLWMMIKHKTRFVTLDNSEEGESVPQPIFDDVIRLSPEATEDSASLAWASKTDLVSPDLTPNKQRLASINFPVQQDSASLSDFDDIDDHLRDFERFLEPVSKSRQNNGDRQNLFQQVDALPGIVDKSPINSRPDMTHVHVYQTTSRFLESEQESDEQYSIPNRWMFLCEKYNIESGTLPDWFPIGFYQTLLQNDRAVNDRVLVESFVRFIRLIFEITYGKGSAPNNVSTSGSNIVIKNFTELSPPDKSFPGDLAAMIQSAYRTAVKIAIDQSVLGELEENELLSTMDDVLRNWYIGLETTPEWKDSVLKETPNLFTINSFRSSENRQMMLYKSRILNLKDCTVNVGRLNKEVVKSLWASLSLELLYLTNDDEERYSIQAEERLLRNLTVQAADPPLGYFIYSSVPIYITGVLKDSTHL